jgi:hypothetical protein
MKVVAGIAGGRDLPGIVRIARGLVEVDHGIVGLAASNSLVERLPLGRW